MTQPYRDNGQTLLVAGNGHNGTGISTARSSLKNGQRATALPRSQQDDPDRLGRVTTDRTFQAALRTKPIRVNRLRVVGRILRLAFAAAYFYAGVLWHRLRIKNSEERVKTDAVRFRQLLERLGGVLIKVGQQLSQRPDLLPPEYCDELGLFLHEIPDEIDRADVEATIKRQTGKSREEIFAQFDFDNVGSASISCVYQAVLRTGEKVAVKIRRPRIHEHFAADLTAMDWILRYAESLTVWRPGMFNNFRYELKDLLLEELDFRREARNQEIFRRYHKRRKKLNVTAPKVYYEYSGEEMMVSEFVTGYKVKDIIAAMDMGDVEYMANLCNSGIEPRVLAKHLIRSQHYSFHECPLFHGDPHPGNILIQPNNRVVMLDFGACGVFAERDRNLMWHMNYYYSRDDVGGMVNMVMSIMEPIPPVSGLNDFKKELTDAWWTGFYGIKSKHAEWWERTSVKLWLRYFELIRKYQIPVPRNMVRMIRATLLYDTVAARLYDEINVFKEFEKYSQGVAKRARRRIQESVIRQLLLGPDASAYLKVQQIADVGNGILFRVQKFLDDPEFNLSRLAGKLYFAMLTIGRFMFVSMLVTLIGALVLVLYKGTKIVRHPRSEFWVLLQGQSRETLVQASVIIWLLLILVLVFIYGRRVMWRFADVDD